MMLLGNKRSQGEERNWSVVLSPIRSEIDKKKISQKISEVFSLSSEEATDLVANTPIILLDHLSRPLAMKVKEYFRSTGAEILLTNDIFLKRKCYRTVWPEPPNLSFLNEEALPAASSSDSELLPTDQALNEIRTIAEETDPHEEAEEIEQEQEEASSLRDESQTWRHQLQDLEEENRLLRDKLENASNAQPSMSRLPSNEGADKEVRELKAILSQMREKTEAVREEYHQARQIFDQKIQNTLKEKDVWETKYHELNAAVQKKQKDMESHFKSEMEKVTQDTRSKLTQMIETVNALRQEKVHLEKALNEKSQEVVLHHQKKQFVEGEMQTVLAQKEEAEKMRAQQETQLEEVETKLQEIQLMRADQEKAVQFYQQQMEAREHELENARRQIREANQQLEQRESVQKRVQLASQLSDKEAMLKLFVKDQERLELEIHEREESMRKVLAEQEKVEREIIEIRQAQRHFMESSKREQSGRAKSPRIANPEGSQNSGLKDSLSPHD
ncbi:MAG: hypothetical protein HYZ85_00825 [Candidatus Omnitrophica bacterium]|nr:hypothetical protein [Candidatus Omnitrophota bacterium]